MSEFATLVKLVTSFEVPFMTLVTTYTQLLLRQVGQIRIGQVMKSFA